MDTTRATIALDYVRRATERIAAEQLTLTRFRELAKQYGCSDAEIQASETGHATATPGSE